MFAESDAVLVALCASAIFKYAVLVWGHRRRPKTAQHVGEVTAIWYYPVKSCQGIPLQHATCTEAGLRPINGKVIDRQMMLVHEDGRYCTLRQIPKMAFICPSVHAETLKLEAPGMPAIRVNLNPPNRVIMPSCRVGSTCSLEGQDLGDEVSDWLTTYLGEKLRLVISADDIKRRQTSKKGNWDVANLLPGSHAVETGRKKVAFVDFASYLLATEESLKDLNSKLPKQITMRQFRPTIVVAGSAAFTEDDWEEIFIGPVRFHNAVECPRCVLTTVDPDKGIKSSDNEPLVTLRKYRMLPVTKDMGPAFGRYLFPDLTGDIAVGDAVFATLKDKS